MASVYNTNPNELIEKIAEQLKSFEEIKAPSWASFVKTGHSKERPPVEKDWWYIRFAAVLRSIYKLGPVGVSKLRTKYGSKKNRGVRPSHFYRGSGNILRKVLQQGEKAGLLKQVEKGVHKGRILTPKGKSLLDKTAASILKDKPKTFTALKPKPAKEASKQEKPKQIKEEKVEEMKKEQTSKPAKEKKEQKPAKPVKEKKEEKPETKQLKQKETTKKTESKPIKEPKETPKPVKETPKPTEKDDSDSKKIKEVEKEVKEIKEKKKEKEKNPKEKIKKEKNQEEVKKVEELVKDIQIKAIKKSKK